MGAPTKSKATAKPVRATSKTSRASQASSYTYKVGKRTKQSANVFQSSSFVPFKEICNHAKELYNLYKDSVNKHYTTFYSHISDPPPELDSRELGDRIERAWHDELLNEGPTKASLFRVLVGRLWSSMLTNFCFALLLRTVVPVIMVESFRQLLTAASVMHKISAITSANLDVAGIDIARLFPELLDAPDSNGSSQLVDNGGPIAVGIPDLVQLENDVYWRLVGYTCLLLICLSLWSILQSSLKLSQSRMGIKARVSMAKLIQNKSLRLQLTTSIRESSTAMSLLSNEVTFIDEAQKYIIYILVGPICMLSSFVYLAIYQTGTWPVIAALPVVLTFLVVQLSLPEFYRRISMRRKQKTNMRIEAISTFLSSIKVVKMYAWEPKFRQKVAQLREEEIQQVRLLDIFPIIDVALIGFISRLITVTIFVSCILLSDNLESRTLFITSMAFNFSRIDALFYFPKSIKCLSDIRTACDNIKKFLLLNEKRDERQWKPREKRPSYLSPPGFCTTPVELFFDNLSLGYTPVEKPNGPEELETVAQRVTDSIAGKELDSYQETNSVLSCLTLRAQPGDLIVVLGQVGAGKTTLLMSILGETHVTSGSLSLTAGTRIAYSAQQACIFADTLKNNILNGRPFESNRYAQVVRACALQRDIQSLPGGHDSLIGPKGTSLSGGQRARVSLARAVYSKADIYLLDDPLSAVDPRVARHIFTRCIRDMLGDKLVLLATHQLQFAEQASKVVLIRRNLPALVGPPSEVLASGEYCALATEIAETLEAQQPQSRQHQTIHRLASTNTELGLDINEPGEHPPQQELVLLENLDQVSHHTVNLDSDCSPQSERSKAGKPLESDPLKEQSVYLYLFGLGSKLAFYLWACLFVANIALDGSSDYYFRFWSMHLVELNKELSFQNQHNNNNNLTESTNQQDTDRTYQLLRDVGFYVAIVTTSATVSACTQTCLTRGLREATIALHDRLMDSLFKARMTFYDFCQMGELTSRYAGDMTVIDHVLPSIATLCAIIVGGFTSSLLFMTAIRPLQMCPFVFMAAIVLPYARPRYSLLRDLMGFAKTVRAPVYSQLASLIDELTTVRSERQHEAQSIRLFDATMNKLTTMSLVALTYEARLASVTKFISQVSLAFIMFLMLGPLRGQLDMSTLGVFMIIAMNAASVFPAGLEYLSQLETSMISVRNVRAFTQIEPERDTPAIEAPGATSRSKTAMKANKVKTPGMDIGLVSKPVEWQEGRICFNNITLRYFSDEKPAFERLSFTVEAGERVGVVGRTGAGKSSIVSLLYRLYQFEGSITIDSVDTQSLSLAQLRASLGVIPQEPSLFCDTLRKNLDPFEQYSDEQIWRALDVVDLRTFVDGSLSSGLEHMVEEGGRNFSTGQRQLVCLARAVLRRPKVLLIDEATASVDRETDALIQRTIRAHFAYSTIIAIAHRLDTVLDYDRVLVLGDGQILEYDTVAALAARPDGHFRAMLESSGLAATLDKESNVQ